MARRGRRGRGRGRGWAFRGRGGNVSQLAAGARAEKATASASTADKAPVTSTLSIPVQEPVDVSADFRTQALPVVSSLCSNIACVSVRQQLRDAQQQLGSLFLQLQRLMAERPLTASATTQTRVWNATVSTTVATPTDNATSATATDTITTVATADTTNTTDTTNSADATRTADTTDVTVIAAAASATAQPTKRARREPFLSPARTVTPFVFVDVNSILEETDPLLRAQTESQPAHHSAQDLTKMTEDVSEIEIVEVIERPHSTFPTNGSFGANRQREEQAVHSIVAPIQEVQSALDQATSAIASDTDSASSDGQVTEETRGSDQEWTTGPQPTKATNFRRRRRLKSVNGVDPTQSSKLKPARSPSQRLLQRRTAAQDQISTAHPCSECRKFFPSANSLLVHMHTAHGSQRPLQCKHCGMRFKHGYSVRIHELTHTAQRPHVCSTCGKTFSLKSNLKMHEEGAHENEEKRICDYCGKRCRSATNLQRHILLHTTEEPLQEPEKRYNAVQEESVPEQKKVPQLKSAQQEKASQPNDTQKLLKAAINCKHCGQGFPKLRSLKLHMRHKHPLILLSIDSKGDETAKQESVKIYSKDFHQNPQEDSELFSKDSAGNQTIQQDSELFNDESTGNETLQLDSGELFKCAECGKAFHQASSLQLHQHTHKGPRLIFACKICGQNFKDSCREHQFTHSVEKLHECEYCGLKFQYFSSLQKHRIEHQEGSEAQFQNATVQTESL